jgi:carbamoyl-phosphate synthase small subunit
VFPASPAASGRSSAASRYLLLEDGQVFAGFAFGAVCAAERIGEVVFTTNMTGYTETLTDPSYAGQIVLQTFPLMGNYGVNPLDFESRQSFVHGYIVGEACQLPSHFAARETLDAYLKTQNIAGLFGVDTRQLTKNIRTVGVLRGAILDVLPADGWARVRLEDEIRAFKIGDAVRRVSVTEPILHLVKNARRKVILWDFGVKDASVRCLNMRGCDVLVVPSSWTCVQITTEKPDGVLLSNGPGDPEENTGVIAEIRKLTQTGIPIFGICLGHQLLALARGGQTMKLKYGHRGGNHPVKDLTTGRTYITSQNHGYAVLTQPLPEGAVLRHINANDQTCEGFDYTNFSAFSVQFHPEACGGPKDTETLFDRFVDLMDAHKNEQPRAGGNTCL